VDLHHLRRAQPAGRTDDPEFTDYYLTMYDFDPAKARQQGVDVPVPNQAKVIAPTPMNWVHGMWLPTFMLAQKDAFANVQGVSRFARPNPEQRETRIFFAGNNLTMDSEEGAFVSALALAQYAFGIPSFDCIASGASVEEAAAFAELLFFYELMFEMGGSQRGAGLSCWRLPPASARAAGPRGGADAAAGVKGFTARPGRVADAAKCAREPALDRRPSPAPPRRPAQLPEGADRALAP
jgi:hypothetical protein